VKSVRSSGVGQVKNQRPNACRQVGNRSGRQGRAGQEPTVKCLPSSRQSVGSGRAEGQAGCVLVQSVRSSGGGQVKSQRSNACRQVGNRAGRNGQKVRRVAFWCSRSGR